MTNYYEVLKLDKNASAAEIAAKLVRLESVWHKREMSQPAKAAERLVQITEAKKIFASESAKARYDRELTVVPVQEKPEDPDAERRAQFQRWFQSARDYYNGGQYDLAKTAIERAAGYGPAEDDTDFFYTASKIYRNNGDLMTAVNYINRAILSNPSDPENYLEKGSILERQYRESRGSYDDKNELMRQWRDGLEQALRCCAASFNQDAMARTYGMMAFSLYFYTPQDEERAEALALQAVKMGDPWGNGQRVLDALQEKRDARDNAEREAKRLRDEEEARKRERERRENAMADKALRAKLLYAAGWVCVIISAAMVALTFRSGGGSGLNGINTIFVFGSVALLNFADTFKNGYSSRFITGVSSALGVVHCLMTATSAYVMMGYSASSAGRTWKLVLILLAVFFVLMFGAKGLGIIADRNTRF